MLNEGDLVFIDIKPLSMRVNITRIDGGFGMDVPYTKLLHIRKELYFRLKDVLIHNLTLQKEESTWRIKEITL